MTSFTISSPRFGSHSIERNFSEALFRAYDWTQGKPDSSAQAGDKIGFYQEGYRNPQFHVVNGADLEAAIERRQPHLVVLQRFNELGKSMMELYQCKK
jgi:hypothetical protein